MTWLPSESRLRLRRRINHVSTWSISLPVIGPLDRGDFFQLIVEAGSRCSSSRKAQNDFRLSAIGYFPAAPNATVRKRSHMDYRGRTAW
jgi:hypothetical protein